jgi:hypothetical protein
MGGDAMLPKEKLGFYQNVHALAPSPNGGVAPLVLRNPF